MTPETPTPQSSSTSPPSIPEHELLRRIGGGSYGEVWLARNRMGSHRAVKIVHRRSFEDQRPFEREYAGIQKFEPISRSHEGFVDLLQIGRNDKEGYFYYVMELADGAEMTKSEIRNPKEAQNPNDETRSPITTLRTSDLGFPSTFDIRNLAFYTPRTLKHDLICNGRLPFETCVQIGLTLTSALAHLHKHGLVHRDIKPSNIIFVEGVPKLADVGLVASVGEARSYVGTEGFIPPEGPGSPQADLYSLGIVLYVMSTGKSHADFPEPPTELSSDPDHARWLEFNAVIHKACRAEVRERYQRAEEIQTDLTLLQAGNSVRQKRAVDRRWAVGRRVGAVAAALAVLAGALLLVKVSKHVKPPNPESVRLYELGAWHQNQLTDASLKKAIEYLNQAIQIDAEYIPPYTALFGIYVWGTQGISKEERSQKVKQIAGRLLSLAPNLAEGHAALSWSKYLEGNSLGAEEEIRRALQLDPDYATAHGMYCYYLSLLGRIEDAKAHGQRAQEIEPTSRIEATVAGYPFVSARQYDQAIAQFRRALELDNQFPLAHLWIAKCYEALSNYPAAILEFETCDRLSGEESSKVVQKYDALRRAFTDSDEKGYWLKVLELALAEEAVPDEQKRLTQHDRWDLAGIHVRLGQKEKALDLLEQDFEESGGNDWLRLEPLYYGLRDEPRFKALLKRAGCSE